MFKNHWHVHPCFSWPCFPAKWGGGLGYCGNLQRCGIANLASCDCRPRSASSGLYRAKWCTNLRPTPLLRAERACSLVQNPFAHSCSKKIRQERYNDTLKPDDCSQSFAEKLIRGKMLGVDKRRQSNCRLHLNTRKPASWIFVLKVFPKNKKTMNGPLLF